MKPLPTWISAAWRHRSIVAILGLVAATAAVAGILTISLQAQERALRKFMRQKLAYSQSLLEGMALADFGMVEKNAKALRELSEDAQWRVSPNVNYLRLSNEFQASADELAQKARDRNIDGVTLAFFRMTKNCVDCHTLVRDERLFTGRSTSVRERVALIDTRR